jgi:hypothetical protein
MCTGDGTLVLSLVDAGQLQARTVPSVYDDALAQPHVIFVNGLAQSGVGKSRKCCFPHGPFLRLTPKEDFRRSKNGMAHVANKKLRNVAPTT